MERSFTREVSLLAQGKGDVFEGEGILAVTKALLQSECREFYLSEPLGSKRRILVRPCSVLIR